MDLEEKRRKHREYMREYLKRAPHSVLLKKKLREDRWHKENAERTLAAKRRYEEKHKEEIKAKKSSPEYKAWHKEYRQSDLGKANDKRTKAKKRRAEIVTLTAREWKKVLAKYNGLCAYCQCPNSPVEQEHKLPIRRGGNHERSNVVPACRRCNLAKGIRTPEEWAADILKAVK